MLIRKSDEVFRARVREWGGSLGLIVPSESIKRFGIQKDDYIMVIIPKPEKE